MKVSDAILGRRSMRTFRSDPVPRADVEWIVDHARRAASNGNLQPWHLYVTTGAARQRLVDAILAAIDAGEPTAREYGVYPAVFRPPYDERRKTVGKQLYGVLGVPKGDAAGMARQFRRNYEFFGAPVGMILCIDRDMGQGQWLDCGAFLDQIMLLAREKGLHTCAQGAFGPFHKIIKRLLGIPEDRIVLCGIALGYADENEPPNNLVTERAPAADFATWLDS